MDKVLVYRALSVSPIPDRDFRHRREPGWSKNGNVIWFRRSTRLNTDSTRARETKHHLQLEQKLVYLQSPSRIDVQTTVVSRMVLVLRVVICCACLFPHV